MLSTADSHFCNILCCWFWTMFRYGSLPLPRRRNYALDCALANSHVCSVPSPVPSSLRLLDRPGSVFGPLVFDTHTADLTQIVASHDFKCKVLFPAATITPCPTFARWRLRRHTGACFCRQPLRLLCRSTNWCDPNAVITTAIRLRSDYDVSRAPASNSTQAKNEHVSFSS